MSKCIHSNSSQCCSPVQAFALIKIIGFLKFYRLTKTVKAHRTTVKVIASNKSPVTVKAFKIVSVCLVRPILSLPIRRVNQRINLTALRQRVFLKYGFPSGKHVIVNLVVPNGVMLSGRYHSRFFQVRINKWLSEIKEFNLCSPRISTSQQHIKSLGWW